MKPLFLLCSGLIILLSGQIWADQTDWSAVLDEVRLRRVNDPALALGLLDEQLGNGEPPSASGDELVDLSSLYRIRGEILRSQGDYAGAAVDAERFAALAALSGEVVLTGRAIFLRGTIEAEQGHFGRALEHFHKARQILEPLQEPEEKALIFNAIGVTHSFAGDVDRARAYFEQALDEARLGSDAFLIATYLSNLASVVAEMEGAEAAVILQREVLAMGHTMDDQVIITQALINLCDLLVISRQFGEAQALCPNALEAADALGRTRWRAGVRTALGGLELGLDRLPEALNWYQDAHELARGTVPTLHKEILEQLADLHLRMGEPEQAAARYQELLQLRDAALETERQALTEDLEIRYQLERSQAELDLLRLEQQLQATQIQLRNALLLALVVVLAIALFAVAGFMRSHRIQTRLQKDLAGRNESLQRALERISELARTDPLTGLLNRRALQDLAAQEIAHGRRQAWPLCVLLADIDHFKPINDQHGHTVGDEVLVALGQRLREGLRESDLIARWGGEEFLCLLPNSTPQAAEVAVDRLREGLKRVPIETSAGTVRVTLTWGIAQVEDALDQAIWMADQALYAGKRAGRDRCVIHTRDSEPVA